MSTGTAILPEIAVKIAVKIAALRADRATRGIRITTPKPESRR